MTGQIKRDGEGWVWSRAGAKDIVLWHNPWGKTDAAADMEKLAPSLSNLDQLIVASRAALVNEYYDPWRDNWSHTYDGDLTKEAFAEKLVFMSVVYPSGQFLHSHFELSFDDSGIFLGHGFVCVYTLDSTYVHSEMVG